MWTLFFIASLSVGLLLTLLSYLRKKQELHAVHHALRHAEQAKEAEGIKRHIVEGNLQRVLTVFQMRQAIAEAINTTGTWEGTLQKALDIVANYTGWPLAHALFPMTERDGILRLQAAPIWHVEDPYDHELFLRARVGKRFAEGEGIAGQAWQQESLLWWHHKQTERMPYDLVVEVALPVFSSHYLVAMLVFFATSSLAPDEALKEGLNGVGEQLGNAFARFHMQEEFEKLNHRLKEINEDKSQFLAMASHDLKNPLNSISLMAELLSQEHLSQEEIVDFAGKIAKVARETTRLVQKLLDVNAIESGCFNLHIQPVNLYNLVVRVSEKYHTTAEAKGQRLFIQAETKTVWVYGDEEYMKEVLENLVSNALKFMLPGPPVRTVMLSCFERTGEGCVTVSDEGPGMSEADCQRAFHRYTKLKAKPTGEEHSTGLGLSIVCKLVEYMQGRVILDSQVGKGTTFTVCLPSAPANPQNAPHPLLDNTPHPGFQTP